MIEDKKNFIIPNRLTFEEFESYFEQPIEELYKNDKTSE